jgi:predicted Zn-dependent protease with MMP-like domain
VEETAGATAWISRARFRELVTQALDGIPPAVQDTIRNVEIVVEDAPTTEVLASLGLAPEAATLFGLYEGVPPIERGNDFPLLPDRIVLYYGALTDAHRDEYHLRREVRRTIIHELGHHFGFDDRHLRGRGY